MREDNWYKWLFIAMLLHVFIIGAFSIPIKSGHKKIDLSSYSVHLVGDMGSEGPKAAPQAAAPQVSKSVPAPPPKAKPTKAKSLPPAPTSTSKTRTLAPIKKEVPQSTEKDDVRRLDKRIRQMQSSDTTSIDEKIRQMQKHVQYMDVSGGGGKGKGSRGLSSSGGSTPLDPALEGYYSDVQSALIDAWHTPLSAKKDLQTLVTITIRKDGRITDWQIDQGSGNRVYDESITRTLRSITKLPPIPASLNSDSIQLSFRFIPQRGL